jgi:tRNA (guanine37-N1)-methyltransferase
MNVRIITIFPGFFDSCLGEGLLGKAADKGLAPVEAVDLRAFAEGRHKQVDDTPYGGGPGMVMKVDVWARAIEQARADLPGARVILLSPQGRRLDDAAARRLAREPALVFCCGRYEGIDERVAEHLVDEELSIGDYVLTGGEAAALVAIDAIARKLPGVVGRAESVEGDTFTAGLKFPQFTRPPEFRGWQVPDELQTGDHAQIAAWRAREASRRTAQRRPDLLGPASAHRVRVAAANVDACAVEALTAAAAEYGFREIVVFGHDQTPLPAGVRRLASPRNALRKWGGELLVSVARQAAPGQLPLEQVVAAFGRDGRPVTVLWNCEPPAGALIAAPCWAAAADSLPALLAWLDRVFGRSLAAPLAAR